MSAETSKCPQCGTPQPQHAPAGLCPNCLMALNLRTETGFAEDAADAPPVLPPEQIAPHFPQLEILAFLGRGGMGVVYKARQKSLNRFAALKLLAPERVNDLPFAERFAREAQALAALNHPNIITIYDFGQAGGFYYLLMEFVDGVNLRQLLRARKFTPEEALTIVPPLCDALQFAHDRGIVHRDIKPENLLLDKSGRVKVADFGIAKMLAATTGENLAAAAKAPDATTRNHLGTPGYRAPEQKADPQHVDNRADIYSLGVVFYELLTGELPGRRLEPPSRKVQIDVRLDEVVLRALEQNPGLRYQQVSEVKTLVETIAATGGNPGKPAAASPLPTVPPARSVSSQIKKQTSPAAIGLLLAGLLTVMSALAGALFLLTALYQLNSNARMRLEMAGMQSEKYSQVLAELDQQQAAIRSKIEALSDGHNERQIQLEKQAAETARKMERIKAELTQAQRDLSDARQFSVARKWGPIVTYISPLLIAACLLSGALIIYGATQFLSLRRIRWAKAASILALCTPPGLLIGLPCGLWGLMILARPEVSEVFSASRAPLAPRPNRRPPFISLAVALTFAGAIILGWLCVPLLGPPRSQWLLGLFCLLACASVVITQWLKHFATPKLQRLSFQIGWWLALIGAIPFAGFSAFFIHALASQGFKWHPAPDEAIIVPLIWLGSILLPGCAWRLWRAVNTEAKTPSEAAPVAAPSVPFSGRRKALWFCLIGVATLLPLKWLLTARTGTSTNPTTRPVIAAPFTGQLDQCSVELLAIAQPPLASNQCWLPNGAPSQKPFPLDYGVDSGSIAGMDVRILAFRFRNESTNVLSSPVVRVLAPPGATLGNSSLEPQADDPGELLFRQEIDSPLHTRQINLSIGLANGDWSTTIQAGHNPKGMNAHRQSSSEQEGVWMIGYHGVPALDGQIAVSCNYTKRPDWETRMVCKTVAGQVTVIPETSSSFATNVGTGLLVVSADEFDRIREFRVEGRKYQWAEFKQVSFQPGNLTSVEITTPAGITSSVVAKAAVEQWVPPLLAGEKPDLTRIRQEIQTHMEQHRYEAALQRQIWYFNHALEYGEVNAVRLSFGISNWGELGRRYPQAKQALIQIRDRDALIISEGRGYGELWSELQSLNRELLDDDATVALFKSTYQNNPKWASQGYFYAQDLLVQAGEYELCLSCLHDPRQRFESILDTYYLRQKSALPHAQNEQTTVPSPGLRNRTFPGANREAQAADSFVKAVCQLVEIMVGTGQQVDAAQMLEEALAVHTDPRLSSAISDASEAIRKKRAKTGVKTETPSPNAAPAPINLERSK